jgi:hypothetical protein
MPLTSVDKDTHDLVASCAAAMRTKQKRVVSRGEVVRIAVTALAKKLKIEAPSESL